MTKTSWTLVAVAAIALAATFITASAMPPDKVTICHFPPGNPAHPVVLDIGDPAVDTHLNNHPGDFNMDEEPGRPCEASPSSRSPQ